MAPPENYVPSSRRTTLRPLSRRNIQATSPSDFWWGFLFPPPGRGLGWVYLIEAFSMDFLFSTISFKTIVMSSIENKNDKRTVRIDFAPMVDLGFLLITFFIYTTTLMEQKAFGLNVPADGTETNAPVSATITLSLKENGVVDYLEGNEKHILAKGTAYLYGKPSLREHLLNKRQRIISQLGTDDQYTVIIQPSANTSYKEVVDIFDEMTITDIKKYVLVDDKAKQ